jgi:TIR domain-containing protein
MAISTPRTPGRIFISYRRDETDFPAGWLYERLAAHFGPDQVFKDVDSIELGDDFAEVIADAVGTCDVLLVLIGAQWLAITDRAGHRRLEHSDDFVRLEIEAALQRNVRVIPILLGSARMPQAHELPASLGKLVRRQALELNPNRFEADTRRLVRVVEKTLAEEEARREAEARRPTEDGRLTTVQTMAASLRADGQAEVDAAEAALRRLASDENERVAQAAQAALHSWEVEQGRRRSEAKQRTEQADEERQRPERPEKAPRPVPPPTKFVARVPLVEATDAGQATVSGEPPTPAPPSPSGSIPAADRPARRRLLVAGLALAGLLAAGGVAYAQYGRDSGDEGAAGGPGASSGPTATPSPTTPADEQCTNEIRSNLRWVCLTSAVIANGKITINYDVAYAGFKPNVNTGYHVHIYGGDGKNPPDYTMSSHWPKSKGKYIWVDRRPYVLDTDDPKFTRAIGHAPKLCARIAIAGHGLVQDKKGGYKTGNCVPITQR